MGHYGILIPALTGYLVLSVPVAAFDIYIYCPNYRVNIKIPEICKHLLMLHQLKSSTVFVISLFTIPHYLFHISEYVHLQICYLLVWRSAAYLKLAWMQGLSMGYKLLHRHHICSYCGQTNVYMCCKLAFKRLFYNEFLLLIEVNWYENTD